MYLYGNMYVVMYDKQQGESVAGSVHDEDHTIYLPSHSGCQKKEKKSNQ